MEDAVETVLVSQPKENMMDQVVLTLENASVSGENNEDTMFVKEVHFDELSDVGEAKKCKGNETKVVSPVFPPRSIAFHTTFDDGKDLKHSQENGVMPFAQLCFDRKHGEVVATIARASSRGRKMRTKKVPKRICTEPSTPNTVPALVTMSSSSSDSDSLSTLTEADHCITDKVLQGWKPPNPDALPFVLGMAPIVSSDSGSENNLYLLHDIGEAPHPTFTWSARPHWCSRAIKKLVGASFRGSSGVLKLTPKRRRRLTTDSTNHPISPRLLPVFTSSKGCGYELIEE